MALEVTRSPNQRAGACAAEVRGWTCRLVQWEVESLSWSESGHEPFPPDAAGPTLPGSPPGLDIIERAVQLRDANPQFSPSKSFPGFSASGPWLVTLDNSSIQRISESVAP